MTRSKQISAVGTAIANGLFGLAALSLAVLSPGHGGLALSQDQGNAVPVDVIAARKILMDAVGSNMDGLESIVAGSKVDLAEGKDHADTISVMLMSLPHLFPPGTNRSKPDVARDRGRDTAAAPEIWTRYTDFYKRAEVAAKIAYNASRADDEAGLKQYTAELRHACDSCHAIYMKRD
jgi:cytochrome c556